MEIDGGRVGEQGRPAFLEKSVPNEEIPVAVHDEDRNPGFNQAFHGIYYGAMGECFKVVVPGPIFEKITQDKEFTRLPGLARKETEEQPGQLRPFLA